MERCAIRTITKLDRLTSLELDVGVLRSEFKM
jgi:hypothetical protein